MLSKLITLLISPLGTGLWLGLFAIGLWCVSRDNRYRQWAERLGLAAFVWLWLWSTPIVSDGLKGWIENQAGPRAMDALPVTEVAVVLGGGISGPRLPLRVYADLVSAADRMWYAARLYKSGHVRTLYLSGGTVRTGDDSEAHSMRVFLEDLGVPASVIIEEGGSANTAENAQRIAGLLKAAHIDSMMLVTSALHMPRARKLFARTGLQVIAAPTDFEVIDMPLDILRLLPDVEALNGSAKAFKELLGYWLV